MDGLLIGLSWLAYVIGRAWHRRGATPPKPPAPPSSPSVKLDTRTVAEAAWEYERWVIEPTTVANPETKEQALRYIANAIVPLMGHVRMCDVTPELERGFGEVLWHQYDDYRPVHVWKDLMRVSRGAMTRRTGPDSSLGD